ncbi:MAG: Crp/Fnr family transcriptional regulator [Chitinophagaceae bacterium]|nr:Crp/Fnr family transcriptional regulator [Chitinophagaceae bacterium]
MKLNKKNCDLKSCSMCRQCQPDWLPALDTNRKSFHFKKGEQLFTEGEKVTGMYFINKGLVKVHKRWGNDKELILRIAKDGDIVGHRGLGDDEFYPVSGTAMEPTDVCYIDLSFFNSTLRTNPDFQYNLLMFFAAELKESEKRMRNLAHMNVKGRIANALLYLEKKFGKDKDGYIHLSISRQDLASYTGTTYESLFRIMNELVAENAISTDGKKTQIVNATLLHEYMEQN